MTQESSEATHAKEGSPDDAKDDKALTVSMSRTAHLLSLENIFALVVIDPYVAPEPNPGTLVASLPQDRVCV